MPLPDGVVPEQTGPGQESVWDYPRPPRLEATTGHVVVKFGGVVVCETSAPLRVLETSHPPTYYLPWTDFAAGTLEPSNGGSVCEYKGRAAYLTVVGGSRRQLDAAWTYPSPTPEFAALRGHVALYPARMDSCRLDGEDVLAQEGGFYGGWVTSRVTGPFKGGPGSWGW